ncbi:transcription factor tfiiib complex subunit [Niveomyces insectorum RCEF 264]|uniref:Transcription factor tfiiib complex subunit n=1 Tax=Niveomyces insectorum RCEF 264 TaxID=1081102 RepID=A0A167XZ67_9HYPO|nr:transcription factor tfiiib complex subunit [Niveomyces insectorum RCEF 264]
MASLTTLPKKFTPGHQIRPRGAQRINPIKAIQDREWRRKQMAAAAAQASGSVSRGRSETGSPAPTSLQQQQREQSQEAPLPQTARSGTAASSRLQCPNKACKNPNVVDGTCRTCGRVADDSNIVAEVSFGENAQGAAVVQGSFLGHDQGGIRPMAGIGHRRVAGNGSAEARERTLREARMLMTGFAHQLNIPEHTVTVGFQYYKLAASANFVQGRKIQNVVAVCLYAACRKSTHANPCKIMLIDLADLVKEEVFFLGRTFKKLLQTIEVAARDVQPIYVEDLIFRFASKLEFDTMTNKVAETAVRLVQRMDRDWMVMGRRPAGICGACLIMAARMYNFRRTVREVVYIAKVTMATLQMRLDEFKELPSAKMTVEEFLAQDFLSEEFDPPSIYKKSDEYQAKLREKQRSLKRKRGDQASAARDTAAALTPAGSSASPPSSFSSSSSPPSSSQQPRVVDSDGFVVPPLPQGRGPHAPNARTAATPTQPSLPSPPSQSQGERQPTEPDRGIIEQALDADDDETELDQQLDALAQEYGDDGNNNDSGDPASTASVTSGDVDAAARVRRRGPPDGSSCRTLPVTLGGRGGRGRSDQEPDYVDDAWRADEENLEMEMTEAINSPGCLEHARAFANAEQRAQLIMMGLGRGRPQPSPGAAADGTTNTADPAANEPIPPTTGTAEDVGRVSDNPVVDEDEFKDDPEVQFCLLSEAEAAAKEKIWMNENRAYLRMRQEREFRAKMAAANGTKKQTRRRLKKPKIGEGQTSPASTPGAAAVEAMERRGFSKRINYDAMRRMLDRPAGSTTQSQTGSVASASVASGYGYSRAGSTIGSVVGDGLGDEEEEEEEEEEEAGVDDEEAEPDIDPFAEEEEVEEEDQEEEGEGEDEE